MAFYLPQAIVIEASEVNTPTTIIDNYSWGKFLFHVVWVLWSYSRSFKYFGQDKNELEGS